MGFAAQQLKTALRTFNTLGHQLSAPATHDWHILFAAELREKFLQGVCYSLSVRQAWHCTLAAADNSQIRQPAMQVTFADHQSRAGSHRILQQTLDGIGVPVRFS